MSEFISVQDEIGQTNGSTLNLVVQSLNKLPNSFSRRFNLNNHDEKKGLNNYLLGQSLPDLIIKIIGTNHEQTQSLSRASIQNTFKLIMRNLMEQTHIWLLNSSRTLLDLDDYDKNIIENEAINPNIVICEPFGISQSLIYHSSKYRYIDKILSQLQQEQKSSSIPLITLLIQGDKFSVENIVENISKHIPTIILKGTGLIANQLAELYQPTEYGIRNRRQGLSNEELLTEVDLRRLNYRNNNENTLIFVCQPGKDELDESILQAIGATLRIIDISHVHTSEFKFAIQWNKIDFAEMHILNHNTVIDWTNEELDTCLEIAILSNAVSFVELLFDYGASLQRLALINKSNLFKLKSNGRRDSQTIESVLEVSPILTRLDSEIRVKAYLRFLFNWTIENQYFDLTMSICTRLEDSIIAMLLVSEWCRYKEQNDFITSIDYREHSRRFEMYAAAILDLYYKDDKEKTIELLDKKSNLYIDQQPTVLIDDLCSKPLVSTDCMQAYMNRIWYGNQFHLEKTFSWNILIFLVCLCPYLLFIPFIRNRVFQWNKRNGTERANSCWGRLKYRFEPFRRFYHGNAIIRFYYNMISYMAFLILFSYVILFDYYPLNIYNEKRSNIYRLPLPITEIILHIFLGSIALEEFRQVYLHVKSASKKCTYWKNLSGINSRRRIIWSFYRNDPWNVLDFAAFIFWFVGFITRFIVRDHAFEVSKICMSFDLCLWYMRCLHIFLASERLGPKLLMIFHTMKDLMLFLFFIFIFLSAYTTTTYSLISTSSFVMWSNSTHFTTIQHAGNLTNIETFRNIIEWGIWRIFGSTSLATSDLATTQYKAKNDAYGFVTLLLTITFLIVAYVLLLNNLIALFNFTIQRVHGESHRAWCYNFYVVLKEYEEKDMFVPPLNLFLFPISIYMRKKLQNNIKNFTIINNNEKLQRHQQRIAEKYWKENNQLRKSISYVCRQCKCRTIEVKSMDSTFL